MQAEKSRYAGAARRSAKYTNRPNAAGVRAAKNQRHPGAAVLMDSQRKGRASRGVSFSLPAGFLRRVLIILLAVAALAAAGLALYMAPILPIQQVQVEGADHLSDAEVTAVAAVPEGSTMLRVDTKAIENRLEDDSWITNALVSRAWPDTLKIKVSERQIGAVVTITSTKDQQDENWAIDSDGTWLMLLPEAGSEAAADIPNRVYEDAAKVFTISDVPYGVVPEAGAKCTDEAILNALKIVSGLTTDLVNSVVAVSATDAANTTLTLDNGIEIAFGSAEDIRTKERVCLELMDKHPDEISYINVRVVDRPTWRSL